MCILQGCSSFTPLPTAFYDFLSDSARSAKSSILIAQKRHIAGQKHAPLITGQVSKTYGYLQQNSFFPEKHWSFVVKFLSKSIVIRLTSKWSQSSGRGAAQLNVVKPKFAEFFRWRRFTRRNHCVQIFATFPLTQGDLLENQKERP